MPFLLSSTLENVQAQHVRMAPPVASCTRQLYGFVSVSCVVPLSPTGLNGSRCQYFCILLLIFAFVACVCLRPVFAAAILSFCCCGMSFLYVLCMVHVVCVIIVAAVFGIVFTINIVQLSKILRGAKKFMSNCPPVFLCSRTAHVYS